MYSPIIYKNGDQNEYVATFSYAITHSMKKVVSEVGGHDLSQKKDTVITQATEWFLAHYPLLGGLASSFKIIEDIAGRVEVTGRGGTILQPGVDALEKANNFPVTDPLLIITDGYIENASYNNNPNSDTCKKHCLFYCFITLLNCHCIYFLCNTYQFI